MDTKHIRNLCIIAHIDHGKSTLADRLLEKTGTIGERDMKDQVLDSMELERERGITIKLQPASMLYTYKGEHYEINLIDTPGHIDFNYEVSRSLAAVEGAILLVDATQGVQAQTIGNLYLAHGADLTIIPALNKIDSPAANIEENKKTLSALLGCDEDEVLLLSAKTGEGVDNLLEHIVTDIPAPKEQSDTRARALIFDSFYDDYQGVIAYVRVVSGSFKLNDEMVFLSNKKSAKVLEVGKLSPEKKKDTILEEGDIGYIVTGLKEIGTVQVGDTISTKSAELPEPIPGWQEVKPMVYATLFVRESDDFALLREAFGKLQMNDASLIWQVEKSPVLGFGIRSGFLGLLHLDIIRERLSREFDLEVIVTVPAVAYELHLTSGEVRIATSLAEWPDVTQIKEVREPWIKGEVIVPEEHIGSVMQFLQGRHGIYETTSYLTGDGAIKKMAILKYRFPLAVILVDFYDELKSISSGFASLSYELAGYEPADVVQLDILIAEEKAEELSMVVYRDEAHMIGKRIVNKLKDLLPRQQFALKLQAAVGGKVIAGERLSAMRKDVTAKLYGGDVTRKRKLLEKQKKGKKKMMEHGAGKVKVPADVYVKLLKK